MRGVARPGVVVLLLLSASGCLGATREGAVPDPPAGSVLAFGSPLILKTPNGEAGGEPSLAIAPDGTIFVCSPRGTGRGTDVWRSLDGGGSFESLGDAMAAALAPRRSTTSDVGGGDCSMGVDAAGAAYLADLWVGSVSVSGSRDRGQTWDGTPASLAIGTADRPWVLGGEAGEVFVTATDAHGSLAEAVTSFILGVPSAPATGGIWVARSTDAGKTFPQQVLVVGNEERFAFGSNLVSGKGNLYLYYLLADGDRSRHMVAVSKDRGLTWTHKVAGELPYEQDVCGTYPTGIFPVAAADEDGGVYLLTSYANPTTKRQDLFLFVSPDEGESWKPPILLTDGKGDRIFPWIAAAGGGRIGLVWYESNQATYPGHVSNPAERATNCGGQTGSETEWSIRYAESQNALAESPSFTQALVQPDPILQGPMKRPYAEVIQVAFDAGGRAAVVYVTDTAETIGSTVFALQGS